MTPEDLLKSPRLDALQEDLVAGNVAALNAFWEEVAQQGTPLIEPLEGDDQHFLVTFLWRGGDESGDVVVNFTLAGQGSGSEALHHLPGTDIWHISYRVRNDTRDSYQFSVSGTTLTDPLNPRTHVFPGDDGNRTKGWESSVLELPQAPPQPWTASRSGVPAGQVTLHRVPSDILGDERRVWVYAPSDYNPDGGPYSLLLLLDGWFFVHVVPAPTILDNLIADGLIPPLVAVLVGSVFDKTRSRDLNCYPPFVDFLTGELIPWVRQNYHITVDPALTVIGGASSGGLGAAYAGLRQPGLFGNVLALSGWFVWKPDDDEAYEWLARQYVTSPRLPLRFYLDAGRYDALAPSPEAPTLLVTVRHIRDVLLAKGYPVHYAEYSGGHNPMNWQGTLADGLLALLGKGKGDKD
jgi:enterochelin esterase-like enzyme